MNEKQLRQALQGLAIPEIVYFPSLGSTNDEAALRSAAGAAHLTLVVADEQTAGRGRAGRRWITPAGTALAFTLVLRPSGSITATLYAGLGALAVCCTLREDYGLRAHIKWPNDVLLDGRKVAGVLVETQWIGDSLQAVLIGIGVNLSPRSVPDPAVLAYPAACVESFTLRRLEPEIILRQIIARLVYWQTRLESPSFVAAWQEYLAWKDMWVSVLDENGQEIQKGLLQGLSAAGTLQLQDSAGETIIIHAGDLRLRLNGAADS